MDDRLTELEVKVAFQENLLGELDEVIQLLRRQIESLQREVEELKETREELGDEPYEKPPHY